MLSGLRRLWGSGPSLLRRMVPPGSFGGRAAMLAGGTVLVQLVALAAAPALTRLYGPEAFGHLAVQASLVAMVLTLATGRYEIAIPLARGREAAVNLLAVCMTLLLAVAGLATAASLAYPGRIAAGLGIPDIAPLLWLVPIGVVLTGAYEVLSYVAIRTSDYRPLVVSKFAQSVSQVAAQLGLGFVQNGSLPLLAGDLAGRPIGILALARALLKPRREALEEVSWRGMLAAAHEFRRFPLFLTFSSALNTANANLIPLMVAALFDSHAAGLLSLAYRVVFLPLGLVGQSVSQVFLGEAARIFREDPARLAAFVRSIAVRLALLGLLPAAVILVAGPQLFAFVFGRGWYESGEIARILVVTFVVQFVYNPISHLFSILGRQQGHLVWSAALLATSTTALYLGSRTGSLRLGLTAFALASAIVYGAALWSFARWLTPLTATSPTKHPARMP